jgi:adenylate cyclase
MSIEIERKFLVEGDGWKSAAGAGLVCRQGYLVSDKQKTVRVRILGDHGFLAVKGATSGISRMEFEYEIDRPDAAYLLMLCDTVIEKTRYMIEYKAVTWEIDVFSGANEGLVMAEIELESEEQEFELPDWAGKEVSDDPRYYNACLARHPFTAW